MYLNHLEDRKISSVKNLFWKKIESEDRIILYLCQKLGINEIISRILVNRSIKDHKAAEEFLNPRIKDILPDPFLMKDMDKAAERIIKAIIKNEKITIFADYDVDGATSSALLKRFFKECGVNVDVYVPDRIKEGYGPNIQAMHIIRQKGCDLMITVDCGTTAFAALQEASDIGLDVIVIDHHMTDGEIPNVVAVVNPNRVDDNFPYKKIAAVAVAFFTTIAVRSKLRSFGFFKEKKQEPDLIKFLDLVALGTVCDVMPLTGVNRAFVFRGLQLLSMRNNLGLKVLGDVAKLDTKPMSFHLGYVIGPRINAGGRIGKPELGSSLLTTDDINEAHKISAELNTLNDERKNIEKIALEEIINQIKLEGVEGPIVFAIGEDWHIGIIGILASRIKEMYNKPVFVISINDGIGKGSARSIDGIDIGMIIQSAKFEGLLIDGGGHAMAGGLTIEACKVQDFMNYSIKKIKKINSLELHFQKASEIMVDSVIALRSVNNYLMEDISKLEPFGSGNPQPRFAILNLNVVRLLKFGISHVSLFLKEMHDIASNKIVKGVFFKALENNLGDLILNSIGKNIDIICTIHSDSWEKERVKLIIEDISFHE